MSNADVEVLPGFNRADALYVAECLEGKWGEGRRTDAETLAKAAAFMRAAIATNAHVSLVLPVVHASQR